MLNCLIVANAFLLCFLILVVYRNVCKARELWIMLEDTRKIQDNAYNIMLQAINYRDILEKHLKDNNIEY